MVSISSTLLGVSFISEFIRIVDHPKLGLISSSKDLRSNNWLSFLV
jgi:hypothetical protein